MQTVSELPPLARLDDWLGVWAVRPETLCRIATAARTLNWASHQAAFTAREEQPSSFTVKEKGKKVAVVPLRGLLMKSVPSFGGTSTVMARRALRVATADPEVVAVMLDIDSPGGTVAGTEGLADDIIAARRAGKRVWAQIDDLGASAAYWAASQAEKVFASGRTADVGSVGVMMVVESDPADGNLTLFSSGDLKAPGVAGPLSEGQREHLQSMVNGWAEEFAAAVFDKRTGRGGKIEADARPLVLRGGDFLAPKALELGLIDGIQPPEETLRQIVGK